jgi:hypothetical protein
MYFVLEPDEDCRDYGAGDSTADRGTLADGRCSGCGFRGQSNAFSPDIFGFGLLVSVVRVIHDETAGGARRKTRDPRFLASEQIGFGGGHRAFGYVLDCGHLLAVALSRREGGVGRFASELLSFRLGLARRAAVG